MASIYSAKSTAETILSTELNSLADDGNKITTAPLSNDASNERYLFCDLSFDIATQASARSSGATIDVYIIPEVDGTFAYGGDSLDPSGHFRGSFSFDAAVTARNNAIEGVKLPNSDFHVLLINNTGQALAASGNVLKMERYKGYEDG